MVWPSHLRFLWSVGLCICDVGFPMGPNPKTRSARWCTEWSRITLETNINMCFLELHFPIFQRSGQAGGKPCFLNEEMAFRSPRVFMVVWYVIWFGTCLNCIVYLCSAFFGAFQLPAFINVWGCATPKKNIADPWGWYICRLIYHKHQANVGKYRNHTWILWPMGYRCVHVFFVFFGLLESVAWPFLNSFMLWKMWSVWSQCQMLDDDSCGVVSEGDSGFSGRRPQTSAKRGWDDELLKQCQCWVWNMYSTSYI